MSSKPNTHTKGKDISYYCFFSNSYAFSGRIASDDQIPIVIFPHRLILIEQVKYWFRNALEDMFGACAVTNVKRDTCVASHLIPKAVVEVSKAICELSYESSFPSLRTCE